MRSVWEKGQQAARRATKKAVALKPMVMLAWLSCVGREKGRRV